MNYSVYIVNPIDGKDFVYIENNEYGDLNNYRTYCRWLDREFHKQGRRMIYSTFIYNGEYLRHLSERFPVFWYGGVDNLEDVIAQLKERYNQ